MVNTYQGIVASAGGRFAIVVARFNESITSRLLDGALETLTKHGVLSEDIDVAWVPGAFEIPTAAARLAASGRYLAVLCLGAVIRGETTHDQHINRAVSIALAEIGVRTGVPGRAVRRLRRHPRQGPARQPHRQQGQRVCRGRLGDGQPDGQAAEVRILDSIWRDAAEPVKWFSRCSTRTT
jgi:6,7-dimethyl-8-ribityllumazine synthase